MKANCHHSKFKQIWTTIICLNMILTLCYRSKFRFHTIDLFLSSCLTKRKSTKLSTWWILWLVYICFQLTRCIRILPSSGSGTFPAKTDFLFGTTHPIFYKWGLIHNVSLLCAKIYFFNRLLYKKYIWPNTYCYILSYIQTFVWLCWAKKTVMIYWKRLRRFRTLIIWQESFWFQF